MLSLKLSSPFILRNVFSRLEIHPIFEQFDYTQILAPGSFLKISSGLFAFIHALHFYAPALMNLYPGHYS